MTQPAPPVQPRASWTMPIFLGALATLLLHSPVMWTNIAWIGICCTLGCSGAPVGAVPVLIALRQDPYLGAASGFAVSFIATGIGGLVLAVFAMQSWEIDPVVLENMQRSLREEGTMDEEQITQLMKDFVDVSKFFPVIAAGMIALMGGATGALVSAIVGRRQPPRAYWDDGSGGADEQ